MYNGIKMLIICYSPPQLYFQVGLNACVFFTFLIFSFTRCHVGRDQARQKKKQLISDFYLKVSLVMPICYRGDGGRRMNLTLTKNASSATDLFIVSVPLISLRLHDKFTL